MTLRHIAALIFILGCTGRSAVLEDRDRILDSPLTGTWDLTLTLERPYPLGLARPSAQKVCGTVAFVDATDNGGGESGRVSDGVYHVALAQLGLDWLDDTRFPLAIGRQPESIDGGPGLRDSVAITLNPDSQEHIELRGIGRGSEIVGAWSAQSARGTASGLFTLRRHLTDTSTASC